jgi:thiol-disulfide isomerase/thioredoxin
LSHNDDPSPAPPGFRAALGNRKIQMILGILAAAAVASTAAAVRSDADTAPAQEDRARIEQIVHDYILAHPEILPQAMERLKDKRVADVVNARRKELETPYAGAWEGAKDGDVVLVEFFDYNCGYCRASLPDIAKVAAGEPRLKIRRAPLRRAEEICARPHRARARRQARSRDRPRRGNPPHHPGACPPHQEQPGADRRAGVGKTAIAEGLALRIVNGDVPRPEGQEADVARHGRLIAGAKYRGEFEERLKAC